MPSYSNSINKDYISRSQVLSSLVINTPFPVDKLTTSPQITKIFTFPLGLRIDSATLVKAIFNFIFSMSIFMTIASLFTLSFYLPLQKQNFQLITSAKSLANQQFSLKANLQEVTSYNKLFSNAKNLSLKDSENIIRIPKNTLDNIKTNKPISGNHLITINKYPSIQFSGF